MPSPSPRVDMNFAMQNGLVDQAALDAAFGDNKVPVASGNGVHVMGLTSDGTGIIIRWRQDRNGGSSGQGAWADTPSFGLYYNNDTINPGGHSDHLEPRPPFQNPGDLGWQAGSINGRIAGAYSAIHTPSTTGVYQTYLWLPVIDSTRYVPELYDVNNPSRLITDYGPDNGEIGYTKGGWNGGTGWGVYKSYQGNSGHRVNGVDVTSMGVTLDEVVSYIDDPNFEYVLNVYGRATWADGAMNPPTHEMLRFPASVLDTGPADWTEIPRLVNVAHGIDASGSPSSFFVNVAEDKTSTFYCGKDINDFQSFSERKKDVTAIDGIGRSVAFGTPGVVALGTSTGRLYEIPVAADSEPGVPSLLFADPEGESISVIHHGKIAGDWIFADEVGKIKTIPVGGAVGDQHWNEVELLLQLDGNVTDSSISNNAVTATGHTWQSGSSAVGSGNIYLDYNGHMVAPIPVGLMDGEFTIEWFAKGDNIPAGVHHNGFMEGDLSFAISYSSTGWDSTGRMLNVNIGGVTSVPGHPYGMFAKSGVGAGDGSGGPDTVWEHAAVVRYFVNGVDASGGMKMKIFINGVENVNDSYASGVTTYGDLTANSTTAPPADMNIGTYKHRGDQNWHGAVDGFRITKGVARYLADFQPPTELLTNSGGSPTERLDLGVSGETIIDIASSPYGYAIISRKADFTFDLRVVSADWVTIKAGGDIAPVLSDINPVELNYNYNIGMWVASGADGTVVTTADINNWLV
jgi:hypothetical protein